MNKDMQIPDGLELNKPNIARIYDCLLGGYHNFEIDRLAAQAVLEALPGSRLGAQVGRAFLCRVVNFLSEQGIDQFLDLGSGIPTVGNVHEVALKANPAAHIVYVDIDGIAVAHSRAILKDIPNTIAIQADARHPDRIINHPEVKTLLDFSRPVAALLLLLLHSIPDDEEAYGAVRTLRDALVPGSFMAISHASRDEAPPEIVEQLVKIGGSTPTPTKDRSRTDILRFFDGLELVEPGLVRPSLWHPEGPSDLYLDKPEQGDLTFGGIGRKTR